MQKTLVIGKDRDGYTLSLDIEISHQVGESKTVDHQTISEFNRLSISGMAWNPRRKDAEYAGQIYDHLTLENIREYLVSPQIVGELVSIWKEWHLNDLKAGCVHQTEFGANVDNWQERADAETKKCPHGYAYGSAWLVKPLPSSVADRVNILIAQAEKEFYDKRGYDQYGKRTK